MVRPGRDRLSGNVEVDETYVGGAEAGVSGRKTYKKALVAIAVEVLSPKGFGRVRLRRVPDVSAASLTPLSMGHRQCKKKRCQARRHAGRSGTSLHE